MPLVELDLDGNRAGDAGLGALLGMAARSGTLVTLRLSANNVGDDGARALASHLRSRPKGSLESISLSNNPIGTSGGEELRQGVQTLTLTLTLPPSRLA